MSKKEKLLLKLLSGTADASFDLDDLVRFCSAWILAKGHQAAIVFSVKVELKASLIFSATNPVRPNHISKTGPRLPREQ